MTIIDTHAHLDQVENVDEVLKQASQAGVEAVVAVGVDLAGNKRNLEIRQRVSVPKIYVGLGIHPGNISPGEIEETLEFIEANISEACGVGEIGLDFWYKDVRKSAEKKDEQRVVFRRQLELARKYNRPAVIHSRGAWQECFETAQAVGIAKAVFHWYSGPLDILEKILTKGFFVSCTPALNYSPQSREAMAYAPAAQTLIETDCPVFYRYAEGEDGFASRPQDVFKTLEIYARLKGMDQEKALTLLNQNAKRFFGII